MTDHKIGRVHIRTGCFLIATNSSLFSMKEADNYCQSLDKRAHLAEIRTQEIMSFISSQSKDLMLSGSIESYNTWWIGGTDLQKVL